MSDYYLRAASEAALWTALESAGLAGMSDGVRLPIGVDLDIIGAIYAATGAVQLIDGIEVPLTLPAPGYHANLRGDLTPDQVAKLPVIPPPSNPVRRWA